MEKLGHNPKLVGTFFAKGMEPVCGKISRFAYDRIIEQLADAWSTDYEACQCPVRVQFRLPCYHLLPRDSSPVTLDMIDLRWSLDEELSVKYAKTDATSTNSNTERKDC